MRTPMLMATILCVGSCDPSGTRIEESQPEPQTSTTISDDGPADDIDDEPDGDIEASPRGPGAPTALAAPPDVMSKNPWSNVPFACETFDVYESVHPRRTKQGAVVYPSRYKRNRYRLTFADQKRTLALVRMVASEMGIDPLIPEIHADHESGGKPTTIHILNADRDANKKAWEKYSYSKTRENTLVAKMAQTTVHDREYWLAKEALRNTRMYKENKHWDTHLKFTRHIPQRGEVPGESWDETRSVWWFGYGMFGMNSVLFTQAWDSEAPPWVMCSYDGIISTISYVWVARAAAHKCEFLSGKDPEKYGKDGGSNRSVLRRMAKGKCGKGRLGPQWRGLMKEYESRGIDWEAAAKVGKKWPQFELYRNGNPKRDKDGLKIPTDRQKIFDHMLQLAEKRNLLRTEPLERPEGTEPRLVRTSW